jgi:hypothetical protein
MKKLRILIYTDVAGLDDENDSFCISDLRRFLPLKLGHIVEVETDTKIRHYDYEKKDWGHAATKLTAKLLEQYDELWVFGFGRAENNPKDPASAFLLTDEEVSDLAEWMKTHGVMVTGDHSEGDIKDACLNQNHNEFRARGYSLGVRIPRAGQLRVWKGPPTNCVPPETPPELADADNTQEPGDCSADLNNTCLESDDRPQTLEPEPFPPHFLFFYDFDAQGHPIAITQFPDHAHIGAVLDAPKPPDDFDKYWPPRPPSPRVLARGRDKRFPGEEKTYNLVVAYDGDEAGVGRIVADASFHHFLNLNIRGLPSKVVGMPERDACGNPKPGTPLDKMAQFYANLAYWLAPKQLRQEIKKELIFRAARHIDVLETFGNGTRRLGKAARGALKSLLGEADLRRVVEAVGDEVEEPAGGELLAYVLTGKARSEELAIIGDDYLFGSIIESYYRYFSENGMSLLRVTEDVIPAEVIPNALLDAFRAQASMAESMFAKLDARPSPAPGDAISPDAPGNEGEEGGS